MLKRIINKFKKMLNSPVRASTYKPKNPVSGMLNTNATGFNQEHYNTARRKGSVLGGRLNSSEDCNCEEGGE